MLAKEAAARRVDAVVVGGVFFKVWADPFRLGVAHGVDLVEDVLPVLARVAGAGIDPGDADDRAVEWLLAQHRQRVGSGRRGSVRVDFGGRRIIKKKKTK